MKRIQIGNCKLTEELLDEYELSPQEQSDLERAHELTWTDEVREYNLREVIKITKAHPKIPELKAFVHSLARRIGHAEVAREYAEYLELMHPDYFFTPIVLINEAIHNQHYDRVPKIVNPEMDLAALYPDRAEFHVSEFLNFQQMCVTYFAKTSQFEHAHERLEWMKTVNPDHPTTTNAFTLLEQAETALMYQQMEALKARRENQALSSPPVPPQRDTPPDFEHPEAEMLLLPRSELSRESLEELLNLPRESLIRDLVKSIEDCVFRFEYYHTKFAQDQLIIDTPLTAFALLEAIDSGEQGVKAVLFFLAQHESILDFWLGDALTEDIHSYLMGMARQHPELLTDFLKQPGYYEFAYSPAATALIRLFQQTPDQRVTILELLTEWMEWAVSHIGKPDMGENQVTAAINLVLDLRIKTLNAPINALYEAKLVNEWICGTWKEFKETLEKAPRHTPSLPAVADPLTRYLRLIATFEEIAEKDRLFNEEPGLIQAPKPEEVPPSTIGSPLLKAGPKIGRNDPCPCGSGKKYKKCCL